MLPTLGDLPDVGDPWTPGLRVSSVGRGVNGLGVQAQQILGNLYESLDPIREQLAVLLGRRKYTSTSSLVAFICKLDRATVSGKLQVALSDPQSVRPPRPSSGRKRLFCELPELDIHPASELDKEADLPELDKETDLMHWEVHGLRGKYSNKCDESNADEADTPAVDAESHSTDNAGPEFGNGVEEGDCPITSSLDELASTVRQSSCISVLPAGGSRTSPGQVSFEPNSGKFSWSAVGSGSIADLEAAWKRVAATPCPYQGLSGVGKFERELAVGVRLGSIVAKMITDGSNLDDFAQWIHVLDAQMPGEWGQLNHSRWFAEKFGDCLLQAVHEFQVKHLHTLVRALQIPSDFARSIDGFTPHIGESLLIHILISLGHGDRCPLKWTLLDLTPQGYGGMREVRMEHGRCQPTDILGYHGQARTVDKLHSAENRCGLLCNDRKMRFAVNIGDGAVEGFYGLHVGEESARRTGLPANKGWGALDGGHATDKSGAQADAAERGPGGFVSQFHTVLRGIRSNFGFGVGRTVADSTRRKFHLPWRRPLAPHSQATRMILYESDRCPPNLFCNLRTVAHSLRFREKEAIENSRRRAEKAGTVVGQWRGYRCKAAKSARALGRQVLHPRMLLFICGRWEHRAKCLLPYGQAAQSLLISGFEKLLMQEAVASQMRSLSCILRALANAFRILICLDEVVPRICLRAFFRAVCWAIAGKTFPQLVARLLEVVFNRDFQGLPMGLKWDVVHPFDEPLAQPAFADLPRPSRVKKTRMRAIAEAQEATERLADWSMAERRSFEQRVMHWELHGLQDQDGSKCDESIADEAEAPAVDAESNLTDNEGSELGDGVIEGDRAIANSLDELASIIGQARQASNSSSSSSSSSSCSSSDSEDSPATSAHLHASGEHSETLMKMFGTSCDLAVTKQGGKLQILPWHLVKQRKLENLMSGRSLAGVRRRTIAIAAHVFFADWLLQDWHQPGKAEPLESRRRHLRFLFDQFESLLWGLPADNCPYDNPPPELFKPIGFDQLWAQYERFCRCCCRVAAKAPKNSYRDVRELKFVRARYWDWRQAAWKTITAPKIKVRDNSWRAEQRGPVSLEFVTVDGWGEVQVLEKIFEARDHLLFFAMMNINYSYVHKIGIWNIMRLWHRLYFYAFDVEAINESVASMARYVEKRHSVGRPVEPANLVRAARLRAAGVRGDMTDIGVVTRALQLFSPERENGCHFFVGDRTLKARAASGFLGPSVPLNRIRRKVLSRSQEFKFSFLLEGEAACRRLAKNVDAYGRRSSGQADVGTRAWDTVEPHVRGMFAPSVAGWPMPGECADLTF